MSEITRDRLMESFRLDEETGIFYWRSPPSCHAYLMGSVAGRCVTERTGKQYWQIKVDNKMYKRSRMVFLVMHGKLPFPCVDHKNGNSLDDSPLNLREATEEQNARNRKTHKKSNDLPRGVKQVKDKFVSLIRHNKKQEHLGTFGTIEEALGMYLSKRKEYYGEFAEY